MSIVDPKYIRHVEKSGTLLINEMMQQKVAKGEPVVRFGFGQSPFPQMTRAIEALQKHAHQKYYAPVQGIAELRERVSAFHKAAEKLDIPASRILVADGSKNLLFTSMMALSKGDILIPTPAWVSYAPQAKILGHNAIRVITTAQQRWRVTPEAMEKALAQKADKNTPSMLILNYPGNPEGLGYSAEQLRALTAVFRKHNVIVVSDEIYGLLNHKGEHHPLALEYPEGTITTGGLSKWFGAGGWRLGVAMLPETLSGAFRETMLGIASETYSCASAPIQHAACEAYIWDQATKDYLAHQRRIISLSGNWMAKRLQQSGIGAEAPEGAFYLFVDFMKHAAALRQAGITTSQQLCEKLMQETGVALLYGDVFGMEPGYLCARLAYVDFDGAAALKASEAIGLSKPLDEAFHQQYLPNHIKGIEAICNWIEAKTQSLRKSA
ncbi:MAG TPA: aminotransferase class I/II-fold pyridoxal phosphate-dependent enzyme [Alphaproteobacteria bacterium]|nr:aminotransferase class I/II-fold pyridoxal phosphate-dependent enzyme [Alphaproteobacteria bacterium]